VRGADHGPFGLMSLIPGLSGGAARPGRPRLRPGGLGSGRGEAIVRAAMELFAERDYDASVSGVDSGSWVDSEYWDAPNTPRNLNAARKCDLCGKVSRPVGGTMIEKEGGGNIKARRGRGSHSMWTAAAAAGGVGSGFADRKAP